MAVVYFEKKYTETLNEMLERFRLEHPIYRNAKLSYAGRLDPLACGLMIILTDDDVHLKEHYLKRGKTYVVEALIGVSTDTYDIMGMPTSTKLALPQKHDITTSLQDIAQISKLPYPAYSSRTVSGIPLFKYAREQTLSSISIPDFEVTIHHYTLDSIGEPTVLNDYVDTFISNIASVSGDFRQDTIINSWKHMDRQLPVMKVTITFSVSSGVYVRSLIHELGKRLGTGACCISINRVSID